MYTQNTFGTQIKYYLLIRKELFKFFNRSAGVLAFELTGSDLKSGFPSEKRNTCLYILLKFYWTSKFKDQMIGSLNYLIYSFRYKLLSP